jgi:cysteine-rich repeat protein
MVALAAAACASSPIVPITTRDCSVNGEVFECPLGTQCGVAARQCVAPGTCGNGIVDGNEQCDDGNAVSGDGCSATCQLEHCGNGVVDHGEECDDGNAIAGDGCSPHCRIERCGNAVVDPGEQCDDGADNGDGRDCTAACQIAVCGDGLVDTAGAAYREQCDDGALNTQDATCPYDTTCQRCSATCQRLVPIVPRCGDGIIQGPDEACDDHNTLDCGSCSADCQTVTSARAIGFIVAVPGAQLANGETFTVDDGVDLASVFELTSGGPVAADHIAVSYAAGDSQDQVQDAIAVAINTRHATGGLQITAVAGGGSVQLAHDRATSLGNAPLGETVANDGFLVIGMVAGQGGDCGAAIGCRGADDCASGRCTAGACEPP